MMLTFLKKHNLMVNLIIFVSLLFASTLLNKTIYASEISKIAPVFQKGMSYAGWQKNSYSSFSSDASLEAMAEAGVEWVSIIVTWYQRKYNSTNIVPTAKTPSDKGVKHAIERAHELGLKVMLKPHVDLLDQSGGLWRGNICFERMADWEKWFRQYRQFIVHYAKMAQETKTEMLCIGTELSLASTLTSMWKNIIIPSVRQAYSGEITYAANWDEEYRNIRFWQDLDYIGIDAYFPLSEKDEPTYEEIRNGWSNWAGEIERWQAKIGKPIIFTEVGYRSISGAARRPWETYEHMNVRLNLELQANCYRALFETFWDKPWFYGTYWWWWNTSIHAGGSNNRDFTPQNKPAERILTQYYKDKKYLHISRR